MPWKIEQFAEVREQREPVNVQEAKGRDRRRSRRIIARVPLQVQPIGPAKEVETAVINLHGALILAPAEYAVGTRVKVTNQQTSGEVEGRVVWSGPQDSTGRFKLGVEFEASVADFWGAAYDPEAEEAP